MMLYNSVGLSRDFLALALETHVSDVSRLRVEIRENVEGVTVQTLLKHYVHGA